MVMEELGRGQGDAEMRGEMFICGVFSLLDRLLQQPFEELLRNVPVPERVQAGLARRGRALCAVPGTAACHRGRGRVRHSGTAASG
jgi:c-di-GMP-related signal transduction protein